MTPLNPEPHFGSTSAEVDDHPMIRLFVAHEEIAAALDGLRIETDADLAALLRIGISVASGTIKDEVECSDGFEDTLTFAEDAASLGARLPLATKALGHIYDRRDNGYDEVAREGYDAEVAEILRGQLAGFEVDGKVRDGIVMHALLDLKRAKGDDRAELKAILADTGKEEWTGKPCILKTLPMPRLVEWSQRWSRQALGAYEQEQLGKENAEWGEKDESGQHLKLMRDGFWTPLRFAVGAGPRGTV